MLKRIAKILLGLALLPVCFAATSAFFPLIRSMHFSGARMQAAFLAGIVAYALIHLFVVVPDFLYVFGHESAHAVAAMLSGGKVKNFRATRRSGSVTATKSNFFIGLAPYFFPFYGILLAGAFFIGTLFFKGLYRFSDVFIFLIGVTLSFHVIMTGRTLKIKQSDLAENTYLFSLPLIYLVNLSLLALVLAGIFQCNAGSFFRETFLRAEEIFRGLFRLLPARG